MGSATLKTNKNDRGKITPPHEHRLGRTFMNRIRFRMPGGALLSGVAAISAPATTALAEVKLPVPAVDQSAVAKRGYFYVGGKYVGEPGKEIMAGQIYVEVLAPKTQRRPYPLVLIHGAAQTATNWMGTPDGRKGGPNISSSRAT